MNTKKINLSNYLSSLRETQEIHVAQMNLLKTLAFGFSTFMKTIHVKNKASSDNANEILKHSSHLVLANPIFQCPVLIFNCHRLYESTAPNSKYRGTRTGVPAI